MVWPFRRRPSGRHALGAAVTAIPSAPAVVHAAAPVVQAAPPVVPPQPEPPVVVQGPRVELGFRDGTTAALAPGSAQAQALTDLAAVLTQRDGNATSG